jgi:hypothetical protein
VFIREYVDAHYPMDPDARINKDGQMEPGCGCTFCRPAVLLIAWSLDSSWSYRFAAECLSDVARRTLTVTTPSYDTILELDRTIRDFPIPSKLSTPSTEQRPPPPKDARVGIPEELQRFVLSHTKEVSEYQIEPCLGFIVTNCKSLQFSCISTGRSLPKPSSTIPRTRSRVHTPPRSCLRASLLRRYSR